MNSLRKKHNIVRNRQQDRKLLNILRERVMTTQQNLSSSTQVHYRTLEMHSPYLVGQNAEQSGHQFKLIQKNNEINYYRNMENIAYASLTHNL